MDEQVTFGYPDQWKAFHARNSEFMSRFKNLSDALQLAFVRTFTTSGPEDRTIFMMGRVCSEEFMEILLLAANGYGFGALKLLRSLYERAVTMDFLSKNPGDTDTFLNYHAVAQRKLMRTITNQFGNDIMPSGAIEETEREYQSHKDAYLITDCEECGTTRINHTWHKLDIVSMAKKTIFGDLIVPGYYVPMSHSHSTVRALLSRMEEIDNGGLGFNPDLQPKEADMALQVAHDIMLGVLETQKDHFNLKELEQPLQTCLQDFLNIWKKDKAATG